MLILNLSVVILIKQNRQRLIHTVVLEIVYILEILQDLFNFKLQSGLKNIIFFFFWGGGDFIFFFVLKINATLFVSRLMPSYHYATMRIRQQ
jgi:hypothetical protein